MNQYTPNTGTTWGISGITDNSTAGGLVYIQQQRVNQARGVQELEAEIHALLHPPEPARTEFCPTCHGKGSHGLGWHLWEGCSTCEGYGKVHK